MKKNIYHLLAMITVIMIVIISHVNVSAQYGSTVREDRIWNYRIGRIDAEGPKVFNGYHFEGTKTFDNKVYAIFRDDAGKELAYMRQDNDQVYIYVESDKYPEIYEYQEDGTPKELYGEFLLYDFSAGKDQNYKSLGFSYSGDDVGYPLDYLITSVSKEVNCGIEYNCWQIEYEEPLTRGLSTSTIIEGIGCVSGYLPFPQLVADATGSFWFKSVYTVEDTDGNVIYMSDAAIKDGVETVATEVKNQEMYDLFGRKVLNPVKGGIYVQDGKKVIVK